MNYYLFQTEATLETFDINEMKKSHYEQQKRLFIQLCLSRLLITVQ